MKNNPFARERLPNTREHTPTPVRVSTMLSDVASKHLEFEVDSAVAVAYYAKNDFEKTPTCKIKRGNLEFHVKDLEKILGNKDLSEKHRPILETMLALCKEVLKARH